MMLRFLSVAMIAAFAVGPALADDVQKMSATIKMVDVDKGVFLIAIVKDGAITIKEQKMDENTKFLDVDGKAMEDGFKSDVFKSDNNRINVPVSMKFEEVDGMMVIKEIRLTPPPE